MLGALSKVIWRIGRLQKVFITLRFDLGVRWVGQSM